MPSLPNFLHICLLLPSKGLHHVCMLLAALMAAIEITVPLQKQSSWLCRLCCCMIRTQGPRHDPTVQGASVAKVCMYVCRLSHHAVLPTGAARYNDCAMSEARQRPHAQLTNVLRPAIAHLYCRGSCTSKQAGQRSILLPLQEEVGLCMYISAYELMAVVHICEKVQHGQHGRRLCRCRGGQNILLLKLPGSTASIVPSTPPPVNPPNSRHRVCCCGCVDAEAKGCSLWAVPFASMPFVELSFKA